MRQWYFLIALCGVAAVRAQYAVVPVVMPPVVVQLQPRTVASTTTSTHAPCSVAVAVPIPVPLPAYAIPRVYQASPQRPPCPPCVCSPSCTPAFLSFCSPCHQNCRCRTSSDAPRPLPPLPPAALPLPLPAPPPVVVVPFPPIFPKTKIKHQQKYTSSDTSGYASSDSSIESSDTASSSDTDYFYRRARKRKSHRTHKRRRPSRRNELRSQDERVQPVLTYLSRDGDIKYKERISEAEATRLLGERSRDTQRLPNRKEIVFRPPAHKSISNLSVSFQILK